MCTDLTFSNGVEHDFMSLQISSEPDYSMASLSQTHAQEVPVSSNIQTSSVAENYIVEILMRADETVTD